jgi:hypothetical protein
MMSLAIWMEQLELTFQMNKKWQIDPKVIKHDKIFSTMYKLFIAHQNNLDNSNKNQRQNIGLIHTKLLF